MFKRQKKWTMRDGDTLRSNSRRCFHPEAAGEEPEIVYLRTRATDSQCEGRSHLRRHVAEAEKYPKLSRFFVADPSCCLLLAEHNRKPAGRGPGQFSPPASPRALGGGAGENTQAFAEMPPSPWGGH